MTRIILESLCSPSWAGQNDFVSGRQIAGRSLDEPAARVPYRAAAQRRNKSRGELLLDVRYDVSQRPPRVPPRIICALMSPEGNSGELAFHRFPPLRIRLQARILNGKRAL
jgi:hypothetical protein